MANKGSERRVFERVHFEADVYLSHRNQRDTVLLLDISLKGVLLETPFLEFEIGEVVKFHMRLSAQQKIDMDAKIMHVDGGYIGAQWQDIDLDSLTHLRRLLELNLSDAAEVDRELADLVGPD